MKKLTPYFLGITISAGCTIGGLYLPALNLSQQNREIMRNPGSYSIQSTDLTHTVSFTSLMQIFTSNYRRIEYEPETPVLKIHSEDEIYQLSADFYHFLSQSLGLPKLSDLNYQHRISTCFVVSYSGEIYRPDVVTYAAAASDGVDSSSTDTDSSQEGDLSAFVWKCEMYSDNADDSELIFYIDDNTGRIVGFYCRSEYLYKPLWSSSKSKWLEKKTDDGMNVKDYVYSSAEQSTDFLTYLFEDYYGFQLDNTQIMDLDTHQIEYTIRFHLINEMDSNSEKFSYNVRITRDELFLNIPLYARP